jgi:DNA polymerase-3 subunit epsilon
MTDAADTRIAPAGVTVAAHTLRSMEAKSSARWADTLAVFDLETTGIDVDSCRIVTAHVGVIGAGGEVLERREWLVDPGIEIPTAASLIHGVTTERARLEGVPAVGAVAEIITALSDAASRGLPIVAYNASYDLTLLEREAQRYGHAPLPGPGPVIDPLVIDKAVDRYRRGKRTLTATAAHYGVELLNAHDAGADAVAAGRVAQAIERAHPELAAIAVAELHARQVDWCREQAENYQAWRRANGEPEFTTSGAWPVRRTVAATTPAPAIPVLETAVVGPASSDTLF